MSTEQHLYFLMTRYYSEREAALERLKDNCRTIENMVEKINAYEVEVRRNSCEKDANSRLIIKINKHNHELRETHEADQKLIDELNKANSHVHGENGRLTNKLIGARRIANERESLFKQRTELLAQNKDLEKQRDELKERIDFLEDLNTSKTKDILTWHKDNKTLKEELRILRATIGVKD